MKTGSKLKMGGFFRKTHTGVRNEIPFEDICDSDNIMPEAAIIYSMQAAINGGAAISSFYVGVFMNNYTPIADNIGDTFFAANNEMQCYTGNRPAWVTDTAVATTAPDPVGVSVKTTAGSEASYTIDATVGVSDKVYGAGIISQVVKGGGLDDESTVLLAATQFTNPGRDIKENDIIKVEYFITGTST